MASEHKLPDSNRGKEEGANDKRQGGRPKKDPAERQEHVVVVRFSTARYEQLASHARAGGQTMAGVVKEWMGKGPAVALTAEQHAWLRCLPSLSNDLGAIAKLLDQQPDRQDQAAELLLLRERLGQLLTSFQR